MNNEITIFINSALTTNKETVKHRVLSFFYESIKNDNKDVILSNNCNNMNSDICVMLSYFRITKLKPTDLLRKRIYDNNNKSKWIFLEANPIARYRKYDFSFSNEYIRVCLSSPYHNLCSYLPGSLNRFYKILNDFGLEVKPWRESGNHILFILNSCKYCGYSMKTKNIHDWVNEKIKIIRSSGCKRKIVIRFKCNVINLEKSTHNINFEHENEKISYYDQLGNIDIGNFEKKGLLKDLKNAWAACMYSTSASVITTLEGIPIFSDSNDILTCNIANKNFLKIKQPNMPDRTNFFKQFSGMIWSLEEFKNGSVWGKIKETNFYNNDLS